MFAHTSPLQVCSLSGAWYATGLFSIQTPRIHSQGLVGKVGYVWECWEMFRLEDKQRKRCVEIKPISLLIPVAQGGK